MKRAAIEDAALESESGNEASDGRSKYLPKIS